jgi:ubiquinone/menaquinone biosynthesis C-methylase UbiE
LGHTDFTDVTESPGNCVRQEAIDMLCTRYEFAADLSEGRDVLEVACGPGPGLGYLATRARRVVGGDYTASLVRLARQHYGSRLPVIQLDGQNLPFGNGSFDVVLMCEALYYLPNQALFVTEARRILRPGGHLLIVSVNPKWHDFNPSPFSTKYLDAEETCELLESAGFDTVMNGAFRAVEPSARDRAVSVVKWAAVQLGFIPKTMKGKEFLKRLFFGKLTPFPAELYPGVGAFHQPEPLRIGATSEAFKVLFAVGTRR